MQKPKPCRLMLANFSMSASSATLSSGQGQATAAYIVLTARSNVRRFRNSAVAAAEFAAELLLIYLSRKRWLLRQSKDAHAQGYFFAIIC